MKISTILDQIELGSFALPVFQRGYVWNRKQVRGLMFSLYRRYPIGSLLVWVTNATNTDIRGDKKTYGNTVRLILDGQQRITTLYGIIRGKPPKFFDGDIDVIKGLFFNVEEETFEYYRPSIMKGNPLWVDITELMNSKAIKMWAGFANTPEFAEKQYIYLDRLNNLSQIVDIDLHIEEVTGEEKTIDIVVDIFNRVNSGGTKLSKGDLALAKICAEWPEAREEMKAMIKKWADAGYNFKLDWLLRCVNAVITGEAYFSALENVDIITFKHGLYETEKLINKLLNYISGRLGLDHDRVLGSLYSFPLMARYLYQRNGHLQDYRERDKLLFWYIHTILWGRYSGSTESVLSQDLEAIKDTDKAIDRLIELLRQNRGSLEIQPSDFWGWSTGARFYPLLYMMTRVCRSKDFETGIELSSSTLGKGTALQVHHIFPKALLYKHGYSKPNVNAIANFTFLTQETNLLISDRAPEEYFEEYEKKNPGVLASHWIPMDRNLWKVENYLDFLEARRKLLAKEANKFLQSLLKGRETKELAISETLELRGTPIGSITDAAEEVELRRINEWVVSQGLPKGDFSFELVDPTTGKLLAYIDLAWPNGLQEGYSQPVAVVINEGQEMLSLLTRAGFKWFTNFDDFKFYVKTIILGEEINV